jgi:hypothetical protein
MLQKAGSTDTSTPRPAEPHLTASIIAVAVFQIVVSVLTWIYFGGVRAELSHYYLHRAKDDFILDALLGTALLEIIAALGLLFLKNWARRMSLCMATVCFCACAVGKMLYKQQPGFDFMPEILDLLLLILTLVSAWWWILFTRRSVRAQFQ